MSSASNLLGLVAQLQSMENSILSVILEMTMKLSSMTDSGVFVLIENQEGRRFSGKKHLTDAYLNGTLKPLCNDVEVQLNPEVNSLNEVPQQNVDTSLPSLEQLKVQKNHSNSENERLSTKRHHDHSERQSEFDGCHASPVKKQKCVKVEDEECQIISAEDETRFNPKVSSCFTNFVSATPSFESMETVVDPPMELFASVDVSSLQISHHKLTALKNLQDPMDAFQKGTVENKLMCSVFYDFGKELAKVCPYASRTFSDPSCKNFFYLNLNIFLNDFPCLTRNDTIFTSLRINVGSSKFSPSAYIRMNARSGFISTCNNISSNNCSKK